MALPTPLRSSGGSSGVEDEAVSIKLPLRPLGVLALAVTILLGVGVIRGWFVMRPVLAERLSDQQSLIEPIPLSLRTAVERYRGEDELAAAAQQCGRRPLSRTMWEREYMPAGRIVRAADDAVDQIVADYPADLAAHLRNRTPWSRLPESLRAREGTPDEGTWNGLIGAVTQRAEGSKVARQTLGGLPPELVAAARDGEGFTTAAAVAGEAFLTEVAWRGIRDQIANLERARDDLRRVDGRVLSLLLAIALTWYFARRDVVRARTRATAADADADEVGAGQLLLLVIGAIVVASRLLVHQPSLSVDPDSLGAVPWGLLVLVLLHMAAAALVPWRDVRDAVVPMLPVLIGWDITFMLPDVAPPGLGTFNLMMVAFLSPAALVPGAVVATWRVRARADEAKREELGRRVEFVDDELSRARIVHDAMFPDPMEGAVRFDYHYEPIHEIGGDYVHLHVSETTGRTTATLLDVAGHGLAAALTVNRLFGELERILAEDVDASPSDIMRLLNRYIHLTMSRHSMFATGLCVSLDPTTGDMRWVCAGHPPAILRHADGTVEELESTTILLGALPSDQFESIECRRRVRLGDVVIVYTDGAFEARDPDGRQFGMPAIRHLAAFDPPPRSWSRFIAGAVHAHHAGNAEDDVLIATLSLASLRVDADMARRDGDAAR